jgi:hypothetical protein
MTLVRNIKVSIGSRIPTKKTFNQNDAIYLSLSTMWWNSSPCRRRIKVCNHDRKYIIERNFLNFGFMYNNFKGKVADAIENKYFIAPLVVLVVADWSSGWQRVDKWTGSACPSWWVEIWRLPDADEGILDICVCCVGVDLQLLNTAGLLGDF